MSMTTEQEKTAYIANAELRLAESRQKLAVVLRRLKHGIARGEIDPTQQLVNARRRVRACAKAMVGYVTHLQKEHGDAWESARVATEDGWEELAKSVRGLVNQATPPTHRGNTGTVIKRNDQ